MSQTNENDDENKPMTPSGVGEALEVFQKFFVRRGERGKCNWVPIDENSKTMKCTYCGDYNYGDEDDENYY